MITNRRRLLAIIDKVHDYELDYDDYDNYDDDEKEWKTNRQQVMFFTFALALAVSDGGSGDGGGGGGAASARVHTFDRGFHRGVSIIYRKRNTRTDVEDRTLTATRHDITHDENIDYDGNVNDDDSGDDNDDGNNTDDDDDDGDDDDEEDDDDDDIRTIERQCVVAVRCC
ncbi:hypothetical protein M0802_009237 [Mischocyttarus mexicanus]|nr:hypothetical protein M0802_009237 [Mischocyttarus mexicanus]